MWWAASEIQGKNSGKELQALRVKRLLLAASNVQPVGQVNLLSAELGGGGGIGKKTGGRNLGLLKLQMGEFADRC